MSCPYEIFISGETIDLVVPNQVAIDAGHWHRWFNDPETTRYLEQGLYPNTPDAQQAFLDTAMAPDSNRFVLLVWAKNVEKLVGVVSLSGINIRSRSAQTALVIGEKTGAIDSLFHGLEAKARITEHGFNVIGLERIYGSQVVALADWQKYQLLFGFRLEGFHRRSFRKGHQVEDSVTSACLLEDFLKIQKSRDGHYWPGKKKMLELMRAMPAESPVDKLQEAINAAMGDYLSRIKYG